MTAEFQHVAKLGAYVYLLREAKYSNSDEIA